VVVVRGAGAGAELLSACAPGDFDRAPPLAPALRKGEAVRLILGVCDREGGLLGRLMAGLSHDEKKSSLGSPAGVEASASAPAPSVMTTSLGNLRDCQPDPTCGFCASIGLTLEHRRLPSVLVRPCTCSPHWMCI
jgi:hypothetical protein